MSVADPVLFFDGECGLCQRLVRRLLALDRRGVLRFAPLQGQAAQVWLRARRLPLKDFDSLVFLPDGPHGGGAPLFKTDGVIAAFDAIGRPGFARGVALFPQPLRDVGYRLLARTRRFIFGPAKSGQPTNPAWRERLID